MEFIKAAKSFRFGPKPNSAKKRSDFFADRLFHTHTNRILIVFMLITTLKRLFSAPITCWIPGELKRYEKYMTRYCWIKGTYYVNQTYDLNTLSIEAREETLLHYYQWVYVFLMFQAFLFYLPHMLWCFISQKILDYDLINIVDAAIKHDMYSYETNTMLKYLSANFNQHFNYLPRKNDARSDFVGEKLLALKKKVSSKKLIDRKIPKASLTITYILVKQLYLLVALLQIFAMNALLSNKAHSFYGRLFANSFFCKVVEYIKTIVASNQNFVPSILLKYNFHKSF